MKIGCHCGALILDQTDYLPHKAHLIPDQNWFDTFDAIDSEVIDALIEGRITKKDAYWKARELITRSARLVYECHVCGRLFVDDRKRDPRSYLPEDKEHSREILRSRGSG